MGSPFSGATYQDASDQAGLSRLYGGIHVRADDFAGRIIGAEVGAACYGSLHRPTTETEPDDDLQPSRGNDVSRKVWAHCGGRCRWRGRGQFCRRADVGRRLPHRPRH